MAPRAYWKGYLKLSRVSCEKVSFHRLNRQIGNRLKQLLVDSGTEEPVEKEDVTRGVFDRLRGLRLSLRDGSHRLRGRFFNRRVFLMLALLAVFEPCMIARRRAYEREGIADEIC